MIRTRLFTTRLGLALILVLIMSASAYAFAAQNTVPVTSAGDGAEAISGFTVENVAYALNSTDPSTLDNVAFTLAPKNGNPVPSTVKAKLSNASGAEWYTCILNSSTWTCDVTDSLTVENAINLRVVAAQ